MNQTGQFGRFNDNRTSQSRHFKRTGLKRTGSHQRKPTHQRSKRGRDDRRRARNHDQ
jgi:hypothetical protein